MTSQQLTNAPYLGINNLVVSKASDTTLTLTAGACRDSTNIFDISLPESITIDAANNGVNGLDEGTLAVDKTYAVFVVGDVSGRKPACGLISLSLNPVIPGGYNCFRRVGWAFTDDSGSGEGEDNYAFIDIHVCGNGSVREYFFEEPIPVLSGGNSTEFAAVSLENIVAPVNNTPVKIWVDYAAALAGNSLNIRTGDSTAVTTNGIMLFATVAERRNGYEVNVCSRLADEVPCIQYKVISEDDSADMYACGFVDYL